VSVESARAQYAAVARALDLRRHDHGAERMPEPVERCDICHGNSLQADDASIDLDLAVSIESQQRLRDSVAWA
jgi:hypothetical protein